MILVWSSSFPSRPESQRRRVTPSAALSQEGGRRRAEIAGTKVPRPWWSAMPRVLCGMDLMGVRDGAILAERGPQGILPAHPMKDGAGGTIRRARQRRDHLGPAEAGALQHADQRFRVRRPPVGRVVVQLTTRIKRGRRPAGA